ncbi:NlpC/P60 family protein [Halomonas sp. 5021]|uniref:NlpC/P60 family protein n=1 Tax=Halomonas sp. 5021 TaxID=3082156 RepID=UPI002FCB1696
MTLNEFVGQSIGLPFRPHGRGPDAYDCWGLVCEAYRRISGLELDDYGGEYTTLKDIERLKRIFSRECGTTWQRIESPEPMDVAVIFRRGRAIHAGIYLGDGQIMHVEHGIETTVQHATDFRVEGYYRPKERPCR